jgi:hypothetical protein
VDEVKSSRWLAAVLVERVYDWMLIKGYLKVGSMRRSLRVIFVLWTSK